MEMLTSKLWNIKQNELSAEKKDIKGENIIAGWGHQIRSYVLQPYQQIKDSRSNIGYSNVDAILDGDITKMMEDVLIATNTN
jgi:peptide chain release factor 2